MEVIYCFLINIITVNINSMLNKKKLLQYFEDGIKPHDSLKIGIEHEKFILNKSTLKPLKYEGNKGINSIF